MGFSDALDILGGGSSSPAPTRPAVSQGESGRLRIHIYPPPLASQPSAQPSSSGGGFGTALDILSSPTTEQPKSQPQKLPISTANAALTGVVQGLTGNFFDEMQGAKAASGLPDYLSGAIQIPVGAARLAYEGITGQPGEASKAYDEAVKQTRDYQTQAAEEHPIANLAGNVAGAIAVPVGGSLNAATLPARIGRGAALGGAMGAVYGAGQGENLGDRASQAATGGVIGGVAGGAAPAILAGLGATAKTVGGTIGKVLGNPVDIARGFRNPDQEAARRIGQNMIADINSGRPGMSGADLAAAKATGQPAVVADVGGENVRALARSAANTSPAARSALEEAANTRFAGQSERISDFVRSLVPTPGNATRTAEAIDTAERAANKGAYARAYAAGNKEIASPELQRLTGSPDVMAAMRNAAEKGKSRAIAEGLTAPAPNVKNIQFWDYTYRELRDQAQASFRAGRNDEGSYLSSLSKQLRSELDNIVPEYGKARGIASEFFQAENALEAGQKFVGMRVPMEEARIAHAKMTPAQKALFAEGFVSDLADKVMKVSDNRSAIIDKIFNSPDGRARAELALGKGRADELQYFLRRENMMDQLRKAMGNSTTARQLVEMGMAGGIMSQGTKDMLLASAVGSIAGGAGEALLSGKPLSTRNLMSAALVGGAAGLGRKANLKVAQRVGEMLASDDPKVLATALKMARTNPDAGAAIRRAETIIEKIAGQRAGEASVPVLPSMAKGYAGQEQNQ